jgi:anti-sigma regulatory factor (Ser/Thr protein kinase)
VKFAHEALFYESDEQFVRVAGNFLSEGVEHNESVLVVVDARKGELLKHALGEQADLIRFEDMGQIGTNPARIIPVWQEFLDQATRDGRSARGIGEPIWPERNEQELEECHLHEALLNVAFDEQEPWKLLCPYNVSALPTEVIRLAESTHPTVIDARGVRASRWYAPWEARPQPGDLPEPPGPHLELGIGPDNLRETRVFVRGFAAGVGLDEERAEDLTLVMDELVTNTMRHGDGTGSVRLWEQGEHLVGEVSGGRPFASPLIGRIRPRPDQGSGMGLWLVNHLCDLVQIRTDGTVTTVRIHMRK